MKEYIERAALKRELTPYEENDFSQQMDVILAIVDAQPAADVVEVRHGRWIDNTFCSCCGGFDEDDEGNIIQSFHNYCPACGTLMDKEDEHGS